MNKQERAFRQTVYTHYNRYGRHGLPWRHTANPYKIAVSEIMLQQTQVDRVIPKYRDFLKKYPTVRVLAEAPLKDVLLVWNGLGYNRRAKFLHSLAQAVTTHHHGVFPKTLNELTALPGIGRYTAGAISAFSYNAPVTMIETNIRTVYLYHFFKDKEFVSDQDILSVIERTLDTQNPRLWYWALMDYGSYLKERGVRINRVSKHYTKQSRFEGSRRQIRGAVVRELLQGQATVQKLTTVLKKEKEDIESVLDDLTQEGLVSKKARTYRIS